MAVSLSETWRPKRAVTGSEVTAVLAVTAVAMPLAIQGFAMAAGIHNQTWGLWLIIAAIWMPFASVWLVYVRATWPSRYSPVAAFRVEPRDTRILAYLDVTNPNKDELTGVAVTLEKAVGFMKYTESGEPKVLNHDLGIRNRTLLWEGVGSDRADGRLTIPGGRTRAVPVAVGSNDRSVFVLEGFPESYTCADDWVHLEFSLAAAGCATQSIYAYLRHIPEHLPISFADLNEIGLAAAIQLRVPAAMEWRTSSPTLGETQRLPANLPAAKR